MNVTNTNYQQFVYLADSFLHGQLYFRELHGSYVDLAWHNGKFYWHLGPFPAILLMPFVFFWGTDFLQGYIQFFLTVLNFYLLYIIAFKLGVKQKMHALWLAFAYIFGTMYLGIALNPHSWRFAQVVATSLLLLAILEYVGKKRFWLVGILIGALFATRAHLILGLSFFVLGILYEDRKWLKKVTSLLHLLAPVFIIGVLLLSYNYARFGDILESGYSLNTYINSLIGWSNQMKIAFEYSGGKIFSPSYIPTNLYYYFLKGPDPILLSPESHILVPPFGAFKLLGTPELNNVLISAPIFLFTLLANTKEKLVRQSWLAAGLVFSLLLLHYISNQRYFLDVTPFLFLILIRALSQRVFSPLKALIVISFIINLVLLSLPFYYT